MANPENMVISTHTPHESWKQSCEILSDMKSSRGKGEGVQKLLPLIVKVWLPSKLQVLILIIA